MPRVLVVEDSPTQAQQFVCVLEDDGFEAASVPDAPSCLDLLARAHFDLVLSDLFLPIISGFGLCRQIKADRLLAHIPVVLVTKWADPINVLRGLEAGADGFITKGREPGEIVRRIRQVLARPARLVAEAEPRATVAYMNQQFEVSAPREQVLEVLLLAFEDQVQRVQRQAQELEVRVRERTQELETAHAELQDSHGALTKLTAELKAANKELEAFSYSVSHDLRAPLRAIDGFSRIVLEDHAQRLPEDGQSYLRDIRANALQMGQLVDALLAFSRLSHQPIHGEPVDAAQMVHECLAELHGAREGRPTAEIRFGDLPSCRADPALLKQVWINLLANAIKYTGKRESAVIEIGCQEKEGRFVYFVKDNGVGFDMRYAHKLFGVFQRLHRAEDYEGTGVGLAIVQRIIHRHGGKVWADATIDQGATFFFTLDSGAIGDAKE